MQNSLSRRSFLAGVAMSAGALALAACAPATAPAAQAPAAGAGEAAPAGQPVALAWWDYMDPESANGTAVDNQLQKYMEAFPDVKVEHTFIPFADLKQKLLQGAAAGQLPDIVIIDNPDHSSFSSLGVFADVTDKVTAWGRAETDRKSVV